MDENKERASLDKKNINIKFRLCTTIPHSIFGLNGVSNKMRDVSRAYSP